MFVITLILIALSSNSQAFGEFEVGAQLGLNGSYISPVNSENSNFLISYNTGISGEYYFTDIWGLKMKLIYDKKGWSNAIIADGNFNPKKADLIFDYITLPVMVNWHFGYEKNWYVNFGFYVGFLMSVKDSASSSPFDLKEGFRDIDFGGTFGLGYKFNIDKNIMLFFEIQGQSGLLGVFKDEDDEYLPLTRSSINAGILFHIR